MHLALHPQQQQQQQQQGISTTIIQVVSVWYAFIYVYFSMGFLIT